MPCFQMEFKKEKKKFRKVESQKVFLFARLKLGFVGTHYVLHKALETFCML